MEAEGQPAWQSAQAKTQQQSFPESIWWRLFVLFFLCFVSLLSCRKRSPTARKICPQQLATTPAPVSRLGRDPAVEAAAEVLTDSRAVKNTDTMELDIREIREIRAGCAFLQKEFGEVRSITADALSLLDARRDDGPARAGRHTSVQPRLGESDATATAEAMRRRVVEKLDQFEAHLKVFGAKIGRLPDPPSTARASAEPERPKTEDTDPGDPPTLVLPPYNDTAGVGLQAAAASVRGTARVDGATSGDNPTSPRPKCRRGAAPIAADACLKECE